MSVNRTVIVVVGIMALTAMVITPVMGQNEARLTLDFQGETLGQILQLLSRGYGLQYTLGEGVNPDMRITTSLRDVTVAQALSSILEPNGLIAIDQDGRYVIKPRPEPQARATQTQEIVPQVAGATRTPPPSPTRSRPSYVPGTGTAGTAASAADTQAEQILEIIWPRYLGADVAAQMFGGGVIPAGGYYGSNSGGGGGYGGYGQSGSSGSSFGNSGFGGSRSSSGFGSSGFGSNSSNRSSGIGSIGRN